jgi:DNA-binding NarL/FixJ family response regulator
MSAETVSIIIADDHPLFRDGISSALKDQSNISKITQAGNGNEVMKLLQDSHYDIVLMDIKMQPGNGIETTQKISRQFPNTKVIALSMYGDDRYIIEMFQKGAKGYLIKNTNKENILDAINKVMSGKIYIDSETTTPELLKSIQNITEDKIHSIVKPNAWEERMREIMFLMCHQKSSKQIADILNLSKRTIDTYRDKLLELTKSDNAAGIIVYAVDKGIKEDEMLHERFKKWLK